jgi:hypothetical protein
MRNTTRTLAVITAALLCISEPLLAQRGRGGGGRGGGGRGGGGMSRGGGGGYRGGGGGMPSRGGARTSVSRPSGGFGGGGAVSRPNPGGGYVDRGTVVRGDVNRGDFNRQVNVGDVDIHGGYGDRYGCCSRPLAAAAVVGTAAVLTAGAIGSIAYSLPSSCTVVLVDDATYEQCGSTWYRPQFSGTTTTYVVVSPP